jgi:hypothetical protein
VTTNQTPSLCQGRDCSSSGLIQLIAWIESNPGSGNPRAAHVEHNSAEHQSDDTKFWHATINVSGCSIVDSVATACLLRKLTTIWRNLFPAIPGLSATYLEAGSCVSALNTARAPPRQPNFSPKCWD